MSALDARGTEVGFGNPCLSQLARQILTGVARIQDRADVRVILASAPLIVSIDVLGALLEVFRGLVRRVVLASDRVARLGDD
jgi:hypothetical protein